MKPLRPLEATTVHLHTVDGESVALIATRPTVTTVGYGDRVPETTAGQVLAAFVMLLGIGFVTVITASITGAFVEQTRKKQATGDSTHSQAQLQDISAFLGRIEAKLNQPS